MVLRIHRTPKTRSAWTSPPEEVAVTVGRTPAPSPDGSGEAALLIDFEVFDAGQRGTRVIVSVAPDGFGRLLEAMVRVDRAATETAFAAIAPPPRPDRRATRRE